MKISPKSCWVIQLFVVPLQPQKRNGAIAQLVEQRTENPCVPGSIPGGTTPPFIRAVLDLLRPPFLVYGKICNTNYNKQYKLKNL